MPIDKDTQLILDELSNRIDEVQEENRILKIEQENMNEMKFDEERSRALISSEFENFADIFRIKNNFFDLFKVTKIRLLDNSTGGNGSVIGDTATIELARSDDTDDKLVISKRVATNDDGDNVFEMYYDKANGGNFNYMVFGRDGEATKLNTTYLEMHAKIDTSVGNNVRNGRWAVVISTDDTLQADASIQALDARHWDSNDSSSGTVVALTGEGTDGRVILGHSSGAGISSKLLIDATNVVTFANFLPNQTNARDLGSTTLAFQFLYLSDGTDEWRIEIDSGGNLVTTKV